jgi:hypothetical protein
LALVALYEQIGGGGILCGLRSEKLDVVKVEEGSSSITDHVFDKKLKKISP